MYVIMKGKVQTIDQDPRDLDGVIEAKELARRVTEGAAVEFLRQKIGDNLIDLGGGYYCQPNTKPNSQGVMVQFWIEGD